MKKRLLFLVFLVSTSVSAGHIANPNYVRLEWYDGGSSVNYKINDAPYSQNLQLFKDYRTGKIKKRINDIIEEANQEISTASISSKAVEVDFSKLTVDIGDVDFRTPRYIELETEASEISAKVEELVSDSGMKAQCLSTIHSTVRRMIDRKINLDTVNEVRRKIVSFLDRTKDSEQISHPACQNVKKYFYDDEFGLYRALLLFESDYVKPTVENKFELQSPVDLKKSIMDSLLIHLKDLEYDSLVERNLVAKKERCLPFNTFCEEKAISQSVLSQNFLQEINTDLNEEFTAKNTFQNDVMDGLEKFGLMKFYKPRRSRNNSFEVIDGKLYLQYKNLRGRHYIKLDEYLSFDLNNEMESIEKRAIREEISKKYDLIHGSEIVRILPHVNLINSNQIISDRSDEGSSEAIINSSSVDSGSSAVVY